MPTPDDFQKQYANLFKARLTQGPSVAKSINAEENSDEWASLCMKVGKAPEKNEKTPDLLKLPKNKLNAVLKLCLTALWENEPIHQRYKNFNVLNLFKKSEKLVKP